MGNDRAVRARLPVLFFSALISAAAAADVGVERFDGEPEFKQGEDLGYFVWRDDNTWKIRWTTFGADHRFMGRVVVEGGEIESFKRIDPDTERRVIRPGTPSHVGPRGRVYPGRAPVVQTREEDRIEQESETMIQFNTRTNDDIDGFNFEVTPQATRIRLQLGIDQQPRPEEVEAGAENFKPNQHPLVIVLR
jgi:hypothetical protein